MKDYVQAFFIGGLIMAGQKIVAQMIGPEYAALGIPAEFIAAFFLTTRKEKMCFSVTETITKSKAKKKKKV